MKKTSKKPQKTDRIRDQYTAVLERIDSKIDLLVEGHRSLDEKIDREVGQLNEKVDLMDISITRLNEEVGQLKKGQQLTLDYLARIENELHEDLETKVSRKDFLVLEKRVRQLEKNAVAVRG